MKCIGGISKASRLFGEYDQETPTERYDLFRMMRGRLGELQ